MNSVFHFIGGKSSRGIHLDEINNRLDTQQIIDKTFALVPDKNNTIMMSVYPQVLIDKPHRKNVLMLSFKKIAWPNYN